MKKNILKQGVSVVCAFAAAVCVVPLTTGVSQSADLVIVDAAVYTADDDNPRAQAVVVDEGNIVFVGDNDGAQEYVSGQTTVLNLDGQMLMPGFVDTHNHVFEAVFATGDECDLWPDAALDEQTELLQECRYRNRSRKGQWVVGYGHQFEALMSGDPDTNPRKLLDKVFPHNPVIIMEETSHSMIANSLALEIAGYDAYSEHPVGGRLMFDADGELNGVLFDNAGDVVMEIAWNSRKNLFDANYDGLLAGMEEVVSNGITTVGDGRLYWRRGWYDVWQAAREEGDLIVRTALRPWVYPGLPMDEQIDFLRQVVNHDTSGLLVLNQVKMYSDGILHFGTAKLLEPYASSWQEGLPYGMNYIAPAQLSQWLVALAEIDLGAHIHAIGDGAVRESLSAVEVARKGGSKQLYSMTHLEMISNEDIPRFVELNVDADFQVGADVFAKTRWANHYISSRRAKAMTPVRQIFDTGANVTFSSDWTVNPLNPLVAIGNSLKHKEGKGLPNIDEAIKAATINGAKALGLDEVTGSVAVGKSADFVVLERDITGLKWKEVKKTRVVMTILRGDVVFNADS